MRVFVLLFNAGTANEGIHTIRIGDRNLVLMFEQEDDATRYALLLEAQDFPTPAVEVLEQEEIEAFCQGVGYECQLVPAGFVPQSDADRLLLSPPEANVEQTDWQEEAEAPVAESSEESAFEASVSDAEEAPTISDTELEQMRRRLEGLL